jgi:hypothetical protein
VRPRDPRRLLEHQRRARARVVIRRVPQAGASPDGAVGSKQVAEVTLPRAELEKIWSPVYLERLARTYWSFLSRFSLGLIRVLYSENSREVVFLGRPFVLLRFHKPGCSWRDAGAGAASCGSGSAASRWPTAPPR